MERESGDGDDNRKRDRRGYRFRLFNLFLLGQWAYFIFTRMRNIIQAQRRRFVTRRWGIRLMGTGKPIEKPNQRKYNPHQRGDSSSGSQDDDVAPQESIAIFHQGVVPIEGEGSPIAGPSGLEKISSKEDTSTDVTEAESKEATDVQGKTITTNTSNATTTTSEEQPTQFPHTIPLADALEGTSDDINEIALDERVQFSPGPESSLDSEDSSSDEEEYTRDNKMDTTGSTAEGAAGKGIDDKNATK